MSCILFLLVILSFSVLHKKYDNASFSIESYNSSVDKDMDGIDDQTDFLEGVKRYIKTKPKYKSKYYETGYSTDIYGVCTDVVIEGFLSAGYDIMNLMYEDIKENRELYGIEKIDKNIDFRRVRNLSVYLQRKGISLTNDLRDVESFQGGDIVVFKNHIGVVSDKRNFRKIPYLIHHNSPYQIQYEEDVLEHYEILGHYRIS